ncbi:hypothetical protein BOTBODRAFT_138169 [Botryobasidium botryosum FD-172 SS1]|uniref:Auxin efflux carrier n=1 Tax=Botryobasidium botryosum (strain FD-172 SS1) TaxID=930990 RepID=A0A067M354_BOTB1|nr:hypothetical protein BOTBODRAFT_138169 [Botryobasidium botryosum FD-172 SS1]
MFESTPIGNLLFTVCESILEVFLVCFAGWVLAKNGILDKATQKKINRMNVSLFTPCLLFSKVAFTLNPSKLKELWIIPATFVVVTSVSAGVAWLLGTLLRLKRTQRNFGIAAAMFNNSNSLPIALMQSLVLTVKGLKWGEHDSKDAMIGRALTYLVLYSTLGMMLRWSFGVHLLSLADDEATPDIEPAETSPLISPVEANFPKYGAAPLTGDDALPSAIRHKPSVSFSIPDDEPRPSSSHVSLSSLASVQGLHTLAPPGAQNGLGPYRAPRRNRGQVFFSFPNTPVRSPTPSEARYSAASHSEDEAEDDEWSTAIPLSREDSAVPPRSPLKSAVRRIGRALSRAAKTINAFMTIPLWAALISLAVACIRPIQHVLEAHVRPVRGALTTLGNCSIPLTILVLGAYFNRPQSESTVLEEERQNGGPRLPVAGDAEGVQRKVSDSSVSMFAASFKSAFRLRRFGSSKSARAQALTGGQSRRGEAKTVFVAIVSRMILTPMILLPLVAAFSKFDLHEIFDDPVFVVANVLLISSPPALTLAQITQAASGDAFERLISRTIFWGYCVATPPLTILYVVVGLVFTRM